MFLCPSSPLAGIGTSPLAKFAGGAKERPQRGLAASCARQSSNSGTGGRRSAGRLPGPQPVCCSASWCATLQTKWSACICRSHRSAHTHCVCSRSLSQPGLKYDTPGTLSQAGIWLSRGSRPALSTAPSPSELSESAELSKAFYIIRGAAVPEKDGAAAVGLISGLHKVGGHMQYPAGVMHNFPGGVWHGPYIDLWLGEGCVLFTSQCTTLDIIASELQHVPSLMGNCHFEWHCGRIARRRPCVSLAAADGRGRMFRCDRVRSCHLRHNSAGRAAW